MGGSRFGFRTRNPGRAACIDLDRFIGASLCRMLFEMDQTMAIVNRFISASAH